MTFSQCLPLRREGVSQYWPLQLRQGIGALRRIFHLKCQQGLPPSIVVTAGALTVFMTRESLRARVGFDKSIADIPGLDIGCLIGPSGFFLVVEGSRI